MNKESEALLLRGAEALGSDLGRAVETRQPEFAQLLELLRQGNERQNLTALKTEQDIVLKHFVDSLSCLRGGHLDGEFTVMDLGTGAGFPTLPLALVRPELSFTPVDATRKKIEFVRATAQALGLRHVSPLVGRAETLGQQEAYRGQFDRVVVRAVAALPVLAELALPLLRVGGLLVAQKGQLTPEELNAGRRAAGEVGGTVREVESFGLPALGDARTLVVIEKVAATPPRYPRREGMPQQQPLFWQAK